MVADQEGTCYYYVTGDDENYENQTRRFRREKA